MIDNRSNNHNNIFHAIVRQIALWWEKPFWQKKTLYCNFRRIYRTIIMPTWCYLIFISNVQIFTFSWGFRGFDNAIKAYSYIQLPQLFVQPIFYSTIFCLAMFIIIAIYALLTYSLPTNNIKLSKSITAFFSFSLSVALLFYSFADIYVSQYTWPGFPIIFQELRMSSNRDFYVFLIGFIIAFILACFLFGIILNTLEIAILSAKHKTPTTKLPSLRTNKNFLIISAITIIISVALCWYAYNNGIKARELKRQPVPPIQKQIMLYCDR